MEHLSAPDFLELFKDHYQKENFRSIMTKKIAFSCKGSKNKSKGRLCIHQCGKEVHALMKFIEDKGVVNYLEVGVEYGGMFFLMDSFFRSINPYFLGSTGVDITTTPHMEERYPPYHKKYPDAVFVESDCFDFVPEEKYDFIFIDNNLKYEKMKKCFHYYLPYARKFIGFHDILDRKYGAKKLWAELEQEYDTQTFTNSLAGIGIVVL